MGHVRKLVQEKTIWNYIVLHANNPDAAQWYKEKMEALSMKAPVSVVNISPTIGANSGIGAAAIAVLFD